MISYLIKLFAKDYLERKKEADKFSANVPVACRHLFICDICGNEKGGKKFPVLDENWNKQIGLNQCEDCFKDGCGLNH